MCMYVEHIISIKSVPKLEGCVGVKFVAGPTVAYSTEYIFADLLLTEVGFVLQTNHFLEGKRVLGAAFLGLVQGRKQSIRTKLCALAHEGGIHACESNRECFAYKLALNFDHISDNAAGHQESGWMDQQGVDEAREVGVHAFIMADERIRLAQSRQHAALLEEEDCTEAGGEEDAFNHSECNHSFSERALLGVAPAQSPFSLAFDRRDRFHRAEKTVLPCCSADSVASEQGLPMTCSSGRTQQCELVNQQKSSCAADNKLRQPFGSRGCVKRTHS